MVGEMQLQESRGAKRASAVDNFGALLVAIAGLLASNLDEPKKAWRASCPLSQHAIRMHLTADERSSSAGYRFERAE